MTRLTPVCALALSLMLSFALSPTAMAQTAPTPAKAATPAKKAAATPIIRKSVAADVVTPTAPKKPSEPLLSRDELRACMTEKPKNDATAKQILADQAQFQKDYEQIKTDQAAITKENEANRALSAQITRERNELLLPVSPIQPTSADTTTTLALKVAAQNEAQLARARVVDAKVDAFNAAQSGIRERAAVVDARVGPINAQSKALNARMDAQQVLTDDWSKRCAAKLFDELDEIAIKKELAAAKP